MPTERKPKSYENGVIYMLVNDIDNLVYVGHTTTTLCKRFYKHKSKAKALPDRKVYAHMNKLGHEHFRIELIEPWPCQNEAELVAREGHWIRDKDTYKNGLNSNIAGRTKKEWSTENWAKPETKAKYAEYAAKPETKAIHAKALAKYYAKPENKAKKSNYRNKPEVKARNAEYREQPEVKIKKNQYMAEYLARPEVKLERAKYIAEYRSRPEIRALINEQCRQRRAAKKETNFLTLN